MYKFLKNALKIFQANFLFVKFIFCEYEMTISFSLKCDQTPQRPMIKIEKEIFIESFKLKKIQIFLPPCDWFI